MPSAVLYLFYQYCCVFMYLYMYMYNLGISDKIYTILALYFVTKYGYV